MIPLLRTARTKARWRQAPQWPFTINWDSPQAKGLLHWIPGLPMPPSAGALDLVTRRTPSAINGAPSLRLGMIPSRGVAIGVSFDSNTSDSITYPVRGRLFGGGTTLSMTAWYNRVTALPFQSGRFFSFEATVASLASLGSSNNITFGLQTTGTALNRASPTNSFSGDTWNHAAIVAEVGVNTAIYKNVVSIGNNGTGSDGTGTLSEMGGAGSWYFGNRSALDRGFTGHIHDFRLYDLLLSEALVREIYDNPWDLAVEIGQRRFYFPTAPAPSNVVSSTMMIM